MKPYALTLLKKGSCEFCGFFKNSFFTEHLQTTASMYCPLETHVTENTPCEFSLNELAFFDNVLTVSKFKKFRY